MVRPSTPEPPLIAALMAQMTQVLAHMAEQQQATQNNQANQRVNIKDFLSLGPKPFVSTREPLDADDWICDVTRALEISCMAEEDKVNYISYLLKGQAGSWWENFKEMRGGAHITWAIFKDAFLNHHIPDGLMERMREEFCALKQGKMDVVGSIRGFHSFSSPNRYFFTQKKKKG